MMKPENNTSLAVPLSFFFCSYGKLALPALAWASSPSHPFIGEVLAALNQTGSLSPILISPQYYAIVVNCTRTYKVVYGEKDL
jgi:hypothetical protein